MRLLLLPTLLCLSGPSAFALDKQGSAHGGEVGGNGTSPRLSGSLMAGTALVNPTYAARPDNTGLALLRYAGHADVDLYGSWLSVPIDVNFFTDRHRPGLHRVVLSEFDVIGGLTTTLPWHRQGFELGVRVERDMPVDQGNYSQTYVDARGRWLFDAPRLLGADVAGQVTLGWFAVNPTDAARPDNSGIAVLRYAGHLQASWWHDRLVLGLDATTFTPHEHWLLPSELDATVDVASTPQGWTLHVAYERDLPIDRGGLVQQLVYALVSRGFDFAPRHKP